MSDETTPEPQVSGAPDTIYLVYGELEHDDTHSECRKNGEVMWCEDKQFQSDVRYVRADKADRLLSALRKLVNEPQDITSKAYQHALGVLGEFEGNPPAKRRSASA